MGKNFGFGEIIVAARLSHERERSEAGIRAFETGLVPPGEIPSSRGLRFLRMGALRAHRAALARLPFALLRSSSARLRAFRRLLPGLSVVGHGKLLLR